VTHDFNYFRCGGRKIQTFLRGGADGRIFVLPRDATHAAGVASSGDGQRSLIAAQAEVLGSGAGIGKGAGMRQVLDQIVFRVHAGKIQRGFAQFFPGYPAENLALVPVNQACAYVHAPIVKTNGAISEKR
jgi:hypothetical protein